MAFPSLGKSNHVVVSASIDFPSNCQRDAPFHRISYDDSHDDLDGLGDYLRDVPCEDIFKLGASAAASEFCEWVQVGIDTHVPHRKYQLNSHSSPWFSATCAAVIVHKNHFFVCTKRINLLVLLIVAKGLLKLPNLHMLIRQNSALLPRNLALKTF